MKRVRGQKEQHNYMAQGEKCKTLKKTQKNLIEGRAGVQRTRREVARNKIGEMGTG